MHRSPALGKWPSGPFLTGAFLQALPGRREGRKVQQDPGLQSSVKEEAAGRGSCPRSAVSLQTPRPVPQPSSSCPGPLCQGPAVPRSRPPPAQTVLCSLRMAAEPGPLRWSTAESSWTCPGPGAQSGPQSISQRLQAARWPQQLRSQRGVQASLVRDSDDTHRVLPPSRETAAAAGMVWACLPQPQPLSRL